MTRCNSRRLALRRAPLFALAASLVLAACGPSAPTKTLEVAVGDGSLDVALGGEVTTLVTITRGGGDSEEVTLDVQGAPDWAVVTFSPETLSGDTLTSTLTVSTDGSDPSVAPASFDLTITAASGGLSATDDLTVNVELLTVTGQLVDMLGNGVSMASVSVNGGAPVAVEADGSFAWPDVALPYDLVVSAPDYAHVYEVLTGADLSLSVITISGSRSAILSGNLSEAVGAGRLGVVCLEGAGQPVVGCGSLSEGDTTYAIGATWFGPATAKARVRVWIVDVDADGKTTGFPRAGSAQVDLEDGVPATADVTLEDGPAARTVEVALTPPPGMFIPDTRVYYRLGETGSALFPGNQEGMVESYTAVVPDEPGGVILVTAQAFSPNANLLAWTTDATGAGAIEFTVPRSQLPIAPADNATVVNHDTRFRVHSPTGAPVKFHWQGPVTVLLTTQATDVTIPDLTAYGIDLPAMTDFDWVTLVSGHASDVTQVAQEGYYRPSGDFLLLMGGGPGPATPTGSFSTTSPRSFKTE